MDIQLLRGALLVFLACMMVRLATPLMKEVSMDNFDDFSFNIFSPGNHQLCCFAAGEVPDHSLFRSIQRQQKPPPLSNIVQPPELFRNILHSPPLQSSARETSLPSPPSRPQGEEL